MAHGMKQLKVEGSHISHHTGTTSILNIFNKCMVCTWYFSHDKSLLGMSQGFKSKTASQQEDKLVHPPFA
jgi:hypothetical protein